MLKKLLFFYNSVSYNSIWQGEAKSFKEKLLKVVKKSLKLRLCA